MEYFDALNTRHSCRYFEKDILVPEPVLKRILSASAKSASSKNVQPWLVYLLLGEALESFRTDYTRAFDEGDEPNRPFQTYPHPLPDAWNQRARDNGIKIFAHKGIERGDKEKRHEHARQNFFFFNAPQVIYLATRRDAEKGTMLDCGMFLGSLMNGLYAEGYACCPMFTGITYEDVVQKHLKMPAEEMPICAVAIGKEADEHVNKYRTTRNELNEWFRVVKNEE